MLHRVEAVSAAIATVQDRIDTQIAPFAAAVARLDEISGVGVTAAQTVVAEVGLDMSRFPTAAHLASWVRFAPGVSESAGHRKAQRGDRTRQALPRPRVGEGRCRRQCTDTFLGEDPADRPTPRQETCHCRGRPGSF